MDGDEGLLLIKGGVLGRAFFLAGQAKVDRFCDLFRQPRLHFDAMGCANLSAGVTFQGNFPPPRTSFKVWRNLPCSLGSFSTGFGLKVPATDLMF